MKDQIIEKENLRKQPLKTRDFLWIIILIQLLIHLFSHWNQYKCGYSFNLLLLAIYILHLFRRVINHLALSFRNQALKWIGYSFIIPILAWSVMATYYLVKYEHDLVIYEHCSAFFVTLIFACYGFILSIYQIMKIVLNYKNPQLDSESPLLRRIQSA